MWRSSFILSLLVYSGSATSIDVGSHRSSTITTSEPIQLVTDAAIANDDHDHIDISAKISNKIEPFSDNSDNSRKERNIHQNPAYHDVDDHEFEEQLRNGEVDIKDVPHHLLLFDDNGLPIEPSSSSSSRDLSTRSARIGTFGRLDCNPVSWTDCNTLVSNNLPSRNTNPLTIPCGECYTFDVDGNVTLGGLNIKGKLLFPTNHKVNIFTPYVIVQGELEITVDHPSIAPENIGTRFVLTGTNNVNFTPRDAPNREACDRTSGVCNIGKKPFLIAGGKVNIHALPDTCSTHTPILKKIHTDPIYNPEDFPSFVTLPPSCPQSGLSYVSYDFNSGYGNWTGREGGYMVMEDGALRVTNRKISNRGPHLDITPIRPELCLVPDQDYLFVAR